MEAVRLLTDEEIKEYVDIVANAYPGFGFNTPEEKQKMEERLIKNQKEDSTISVFGCFRDNILLGGMKLYDFRMRLGSQKVDAGGLGMVAVHLMHKKEKAAKEIVTFFLRHYRERSFPIAMLYPFRPDFYKNMGFGFGTKMNQYSIRPKDLPRGGVKSRVSFALEEDKPLLLNCYARIAGKTNGMLDRTEADFSYTFSIPQNKIAVYKKDGRIEGYIVFMFKKASQENGLKNDIFIKEFLYEDAEALRSLLTFLNTQEDQINRVILNTFDESFHHLLLDPRNSTDNLMTAVYHESNLQGVGLMYRVTDTRVLFDALKEHNFNNRSCKLRLNIKDSFIEENNRSITVHFTDGRAVMVDGGEYEATVGMDIADFSSLIVGAVDFKTLLNYGIAGISDYKYADTVGRIFEMPGKPTCVTLF
ncbi:MAG TPA: GNAT family N-acetyltransferase [Clostridia bacterium]|nr:GNAT family N-acetyltransferase [Clostridia bacterium]